MADAIHAVLKEGLSLSQVLQNVKRVNCSYTSCHKVNNLLPETEQRHDYRGII